MEPREIKTLFCLSWFTTTKRVPILKIRVADDAAWSTLPHYVSYRRAMCKSRTFDVPSFVHYAWRSNYSWHVLISQHCHWIRADCRRYVEWTVQWQINNETCVLFSKTKWLKFIVKFSHFTWLFFSCKFQKGAHSSNNSRLYSIKCMYQELCISMYRCLKFELKNIMSAFHSIRANLRPTYSKISTCLACYSDIIWIFRAKEMYHGHVISSRCLVLGLIALFIVSEP